MLKKEEGVENRFGYTGEQIDPISEQYYLRARYYNPAIGRFCQEDRYEEDGLNLYSYCKNNPILYVDPSGNICEKYKVLGITSDEFKGYLKDSGVRETDIEELGENSIGFCAEPKAAILAHDNPSPITGIDTRNPRNKNNYPYKGADITTDKQMRPCTTCYLCEKEYMQYANANKK